MDDKVYASFLNETRDFLIKAHYKSLNIRNRNSVCCCSCPFYDERMENKYGTKCLALLLGDCSVKLMRIAYNLEEKGE